MPEEKPDITDALNWLASHSGEYSVMILDHIADIVFINEGLHRENAMLKKRNITSSKQKLNYQEGFMSEEFEAWFKRDFHPDKSGPYLKNMLLEAWQAAKAQAVPVKGE